MSEVFWVSYGVLWVVLLASLVLTAVLFRQLGIVIMGTARGVNDSGYPVGKTLPDISVKKLDGTQWSPRDEVGQPHLVFFGAPYCEECKELMPVLRELAQQQGLGLVTFLYSTPNEKATTYVDRMQIPQPVIPITDKAGREYDVDVVPFAYAIDRRGVIRQKGLATSEERLREMAAAAMN